MMDKFIAFLAGEPHKMDESWQQTWAYFVGCKMPYILRDWHDPAFREGDIWKKNGAYYECVRLKLAAMPAFKKKCADGDDTLEALNLLVEFFADEKRKEELPKPSRHEKKQDKKKNDKGKWNLEPQKSSAAQFLTYIASTGNGGEKYEIRYENEDIWMSQKMLAAVYGVDKRTISYHVSKVFADSELDKTAVVQKYWTTGTDGKRYLKDHYDLRVIIAIGFKINNERAVQFRKWANQIVSEYTIKGWVLDDQRLKNGTPLGDKYFEHLLARIREIRLSERMFYQKITDLYATAVDYDKTAEATRKFFATVQNRMHVAIHGHTAAQLIYMRANAEKVHMGLATWENAPDGKIQKTDVVVAKNYLAEDEVTRLNRMVNAYIDYAEEMAEKHIPLTMLDWVRELDRFIEFWQRGVPERCVEEVTAALAKAHAEAEFEKYRVIQDRLFLSDYDRYLLALEEEVKKDEKNDDKRQDEV